MTDRLAALRSLTFTASAERDRALERFYDDWRDEPLIINKWLSVQATAPVADTLERVIELTGHEAFNIKNPNKVRALIGAFAQANPLHFHRADGRGYELVAGYVIELDRLNPQIAAGLARAFNYWRRYDEDRRALMQKQLKRIHGTPKLSRDVGEIVSKALDLQSS